MNTVKLLYLMDEMRYERNLIQEDYLDGIISQRQYYRYLHGQSVPPFEVILKLCNRLEFSINRLLIMLEEGETKENSLAQEYFNAIIKRDLKNATLIHKQIAKIEFLNDHNRKFVKLGSILLDFYKKHITKIELVARIRDEINVKKLMENSVLHDVELYMLGILMEYSDNDREEVLAKILKLIENNKIQTFGNRLYQAQLYFWIIKNLGRVKKLNEVIQLSDQAIEFSKNEHSYYLLEYFYYYKFLALYRIHDESKMYMTLKQLSLFLKSIKPDLIDDYRRKVYKDTGLHINL